MKKILVCLLGCWMALQVSAAESPWLTSVPDAKAEAKKENKVVLINFTGLDWCVPCKEMEAQIYTKPEFLDYAKKNLVLVQLDFPIKKQPDDLAKANAALREEFKVAGFPTAFLVNPDGNILWKKEGLMTNGPTGMVTQLEAAKHGSGTISSSASH